MKVSKVIKYLVSLAVAGALMYFSFRGIDWNEFMTGLRGCNHLWVLVAMAASVTAAFLRSLRWRVLMRPFDNEMQVLTAFNGVNIGYLANFVFPRIGEIVRCGFVSRRSHKKHAADGGRSVSFEQAVGTVLLSRTWDILVVFLLVGLLLATRWEKFGGFFTKSIITPVEQRLNLNIWILLAIAFSVLALALYLIYHFRKRSSVCGKISSFCYGIIQGFVAFRGMRGKGWFLAYTVGMWLMYWLMSMSIIWAMPQITGLYAMDAWFLCLAGSIAWMVPVPGGFGAYHFIVALALSSIYACSWENGTLYATLNHEAQAIVMVLSGLVSYIIEIVRDNSKTSI